MENWGGSEQHWWLGSYTPSNGVWSRPYPKLHAKALISLPDVEPQREAQHQIRVRGGALIDQSQTRSDCRGQRSISLSVMQNSWRPSTFSPAGSAWRMTHIYESDDNISCMFRRINWFVFKVASIICETYLYCYCTAFYRTVKLWHLSVLNAICKLDTIK